MVGHLASVVVCHDHHGCTQVSGFPAQNLTNAVRVDLGLYQVNNGIGEHWCQERDDVVGYEGFGAMNRCVKVACSHASRQITRGDNLCHFRPRQDVHKVHLVAWAVQVGYHPPTSLCAALVAFNRQQQHPAVGRLRHPPELADKALSCYRNLEVLVDILRRRISDALQRRLVETASAVWILMTTDEPG